MCFDVQSYKCLREKRICSNVHSPTNTSVRRGSALTFTVLPMPPREDDLLQCSQSYQYLREKRVCFNVHSPTNTSVRRESASTFTVLPIRPWEEDLLQRSVLTIPAWEEDLLQRSQSYQYLREKRICFNVHSPTNISVRRESASTFTVLPICPWLVDINAVTMKITTL
jgi:hypothetical protein